VTAVSAHWKLDRLAQIDATVIRIAVYELMTGLPVEIAINEAVEVVRRYGTAESAAFVNGVLDAVAKRLGLERGQKPVEPE
jgi:N utilization substance protein B